MSLWAVDLPEYSTELFDRLFPPVSVLFEFNDPLIFTFRDRAKNLLLAYHVEEDDDEDVIRYFVAPTTERLVSDLETGAISIRSALTQPISWLVDTGEDRGVTKIWSCSVEDLPADALPERHIMLRPDLQPLVRVRLIGDSIRPGFVPGDSIKQIVTGVESALKTLIDYVLDRSTTGRPPESLRRLYALTAQTFAFSSFEIAFREPETTEQLTLQFEGEDAPINAFSKVSDLLVRGLEWAAAPGDDEPSTALLGASTPEQKVVLEAVRHLTPTTQGHVSMIEIGGKLVDSPARSSVTLTRAARRRVNRSIKALKEVDDLVFDQRGIVREIDLDHFTFILRDMPGPPGEQKCSFEAELVDDVLDALNSSVPVRVTGKRSPSSSIVNVAFITEP